ncbi:NAD(P)H-dependent oxidoreductase [Brevibacillus agri]|uniref:NADPH-dependent FMN reductase n=1 Tax=Brevibacillus TaxID=55080 RepID=UPI00040FFAC5|nr:MULTISPECIES: NAD(P)H-dependent oxidoreductase [Brevibacillus]MED4571042.1 NAD(P)H-dependent oxidoreductase [Brevibacillus agri]QHZ54817.1 NAD(P)H-dependent oxidoreductase [Brevibacillus sp. NSP2.1]WHX30184.1 NAD(P)H-dependent oxidoreductase [Brevibacillus agri]
MKLLGISGTVTGRKTAAVVQEVLRHVKKQDDSIEVELLDLSEYQVQFCDGRDPGTYTGDTKKVIELVTAADCYVIGTPIFQGSLTGALKNLFDLIPVSALRHKVMGFVATGGTYQHYLVIENQLKPIAGYFRAFTAPGYVYAHADHFNANNEVVDRDVLERIALLAQEIVFMQKALKGN